MATAAAALPMPPQLSSDITCQHDRTVQLMRNYPISPDRHPTILGGFMLWARRGQPQEVEERQREIFQTQQRQNKRSRLNWPGLRLVPSQSQGQEPHPKGGMACIALRRATPRMICLAENDMPLPLSPAGEH